MKIYNRSDFYKILYVLNITYEVFLVSIYEETIIIYKKFCLHHTVKQNENGSQQSKHFSYIENEINMG